MTFILVIAYIFVGFILGFTANLFDNKKRYIPPLSFWVIGWPMILLFLIGWYGIVEGMTKLMLWIDELPERFKKTR